MYILILKLSRIWDVQNSKRIKLFWILFEICIFYLLRDDCKCVYIYIS